jgi:hypothetical protein
MQHFEHGLHGAVFPADPVQRIEDDVGTRIERLHQRRQIGAYVDKAHPVAPVD